MARADQLKAMLEKDPDDVFLNFSLGMEFKAANEAERALRQFDRVIELDATYLSAYIRKSEVLVGLQRFDDARASLTRAADVARQSADQHMLDNVNELLEQLP